MIKGIIFDWVETLSEGSRKPFSYSEKVLKELKPKYKLGLVSLAGHGNNERREDIKISGLKSYFCSVIIETIKNSEMYLRCMKEMGTIPKTTAIVDDRTVRGIKIGNELGCETFWVKRGPYENELPNEETGQPTHIIKSVEDLLTIL